MTISTESYNAISLLGDEIARALKMGTAPASSLSAALHDLLVCTLIDFENESRAQQAASDGIYGTFPGKEGLDLYKQHRAQQVVNEAEDICSEVERGAGQRAETDRLRASIKVWAWATGGATNRADDPRHPRPEEDDR